MPNMSSDDDVKSKVAALSLFKPSDREAARAMLGLTTQQVDNYQHVPLMTVAPVIVRQSAKGLLVYPRDWPHAADAVELWSYLVGDKMTEDDPFNGRQLLAKMRGDVQRLDSILYSTLPMPDVTLYPFWGYHLRRDRLPAIDTFVDAKTVMPEEDAKAKNRMDCYVRVVEWLYPNYLNGGHTWYTLRQQNPIFAGIIRELGKVVFIDMFYRTSIECGPGVDQRAPKGAKQVIQPSPPKGPSKKKKHLGKNGTHPTNKVALPPTDKNPVPWTNTIPALTTDQNAESSMKKSIADPNTASPQTHASMNSMESNGAQRRSKRAKIDADAAK